jgi:hypothetical protein
MAQPVNTPDWNTTPATNNVDPGSTAKGTGWLVNQYPASSTFNWWMRIVWEWCVYLKDLAGEVFTWTAAHIFQSGVVVTNTILNGEGLRATGNGSGAGLRGFGTSGGAPGVQGQGGTSGGRGGTFTGGAGNGIGVNGTGNGSGAGVQGSSTSGPGVYGVSTSGPGIQADAGSTGVAAQINGLADLDGAAAIASNVALKNKVTKNNVCKAWCTFSWASGVYTIISGQNIAGIASASPSLGAMQVSLAENVPVATRSAIAVDESEANKAVTKDATAGTDGVVTVFIYNAAGTVARDLSATSGRATLHVMGIQ